MQAREPVLRPERAQVPARVREQVRAPLLGRRHVERGGDGGNARRDGELCRAGGGDLQRLLGRQNERFAGTRVADAASLAGHELELAEPRQDERAVGRLALDDLGEDFENLPGSDFLDAGAERQLFDETAFRVDAWTLVHGLFLLFTCSFWMQLQSAFSFAAILPCNLDYRKQKNCAIIFRVPEKSQVRSAIFRDGERVFG